MTVFKKLKLSIVGSPFESKEFVCSKKERPSSPITIMLKDNKKKLKNSLNSFGCHTRFMSKVDTISR